MGEGVRLIEVHLSLERFQKEFTERLMDHHIRRVSDGSPELLPELCVLRRVEPGTSGKDDLISLFLTRDVPFCRDNTYLILNGVTAGLMLSTLRVRISVGEAESGLRWCCVDSVTVTWQSLCRAM